jgi:spore maturation protein CgeB
LTRFNQDLVRVARTAGRLDIIWVDKGRWLFPEVLDEMKRITGAVAVHYTPDPAFRVHVSRHFNACLPQYELCITTKRYELEAYARHGAQQTLFALQGVDDRFERVSACREQDGRTIDLIFIGHLEPHYVNMLASVREVSDSLRVLGPGWTRLQTRREWRGLVGVPVWGDDYARALAQARIGLGLLSKMYPDAFTTRTFEIPAAGAMLLGERTPEHQELFEEDREAVFFGSVEELTDKIRFYLKNESARRAIATAGRSRALAQYHWRHVMQLTLTRVRELVSGR